MSKDSGFERLTPGVSSPRRVLQLLLSFNESRPRATHSELAEELGVPLSTLYRYIALLRELQLIEEDAETLSLQLTPRILPVARAALAVQSVTRVAMPFMEQLATDVGETVMLMRQSESSAVCVASLLSPHALRLDFGIGFAMPFGAGASTKVMLAAMTPERRDAALNRRCRADPAWATQRSRVEREIKDISTQMWASSEEELEPGVWACAAAIEVKPGEVATLTVAGPTFRISPDERLRITSRVRETAVEIERSWAKRRLTVAPPIASGNPS